MASRTSTSTKSRGAAMTTPSERSRASVPRQPRAGAGETPKAAKGPSEKKHKNMAEVQASGRQSAQGDRPGVGKRRTSRGG